MRVYEKFEQLKTDKKNKILNASLEVFSKYGFRQSSIDEIVETAGISKGAIFHYFGNKEQLFVYLFEYATDQITSKINARPESDQMDIFDYLPFITYQKMHLMKTYPYLVNFVMKAFKENADVIKKSTKFDVFVQYQLHTQYVLKSVDFSHLNDDITPDELLSWVSMISFGYIELYLLNPEETSYNQLNKNLFRLFEEMKKHFRRE